MMYRSLGAAWLATLLAAFSFADDAARGTGRYGGAADVVEVRKAR
jgi:hypothetical protein